MDTKNKDLLEKSIKHWETIVDYTYNQIASGSQKRNRFFEIFVIDYKI